MSRMTRNAIESQRNQSIVKANELIVKGRYNLSLQQHKIVLFLISKIKPGDDDFKYYDFDIQEFCQVCGIDETSGKNYSMLKDEIRDLQGQTRWVTIGDEEVTVSWIGKARINRNSGRISIRLDEDLKPYLLQLQKNFTKYDLIWVLMFKSKYSIRLYEYIAQMQYNAFTEYTRYNLLADLRDLLGAESETYLQYQHFKERVLEPAIKEINLYSDKTVTYTPVKTGRAVTGIELKVQSKTVLEREKLRNDINLKLGINPDQLVIEGM